ncbi:MAG: S8 family serine peptidase, partial [Longimicrobiales bacterium]
MRWSSRPWLGIGAAAALTLAACADDPVQPADRFDDFAPASSVAPAQDGRYLIWLRADGAVPRHVSREVASMGARVRHDLREIRFLAVENLSSRHAAELARRSDIRAVVPDYQVQWIPPSERTNTRTSRMPARARGPLQGTDQTGAFFFADQWNIRQIQADDAYAATPTGAGALVCVLDSGIDPGQQDLVGKVDLTKSVSFVPTEPFIEDLFFHGTFVAGLISSNGIGTASVAPDATLCAVKVLDLTGSGSFSGVLAGVVHAALVGADVANLSLGGYFPKTLPGIATLREAFRQAFIFARDHGTQIVVAAGNDGANLDEDGDMIVLPAEVPGAISVAATGPINQMNFDALAAYTNFGSRLGGVEIAAPGGADGADAVVVEDFILGPCSRFAPFCGADGIYVFANGTSAAAPHVSGVGALAESFIGGNQRAKFLDACILLNTDVI